MPQGYTSMVSLTGNGATSVSASNGGSGVGGNHMYATIGTQDSKYILAKTLKPRKLIVYVCLCVVFSA